MFWSSGPDYKTITSFSYNSKVVKTSFHPCKLFRTEFPIHVYELIFGFIRWMRTLYLNRRVVARCESPYLFFSGFSFSSPPFPFPLSSSSAFIQSSVVYKIFPLVFMIFIFPIAVARFSHLLFAFFFLKGVTGGIRYRFAGFLKQLEGFFQTTCL